MLKRAVATHGIPNKLYLDNGSSYRNSQLSFICGGIGCVGKTDSEAKRRNAAEPHVGSRSVLEAA